MIKTSRAGALLLLLSLSIPIACQYSPPEVSNDGGSGGAGTGGKNNGGSSATAGGGEAGSGGEPSTGSTASSSSSSSGNSGSGGGPVSMTIACGAAECGTPDVCCTNQMPPMLQLACMLPDKCLFLGIQCDGPEDCSPGQQCCGFWNGTNYDAVMCSDICDAPNYVLCRPQDFNPMCPDGKTCFVENFFGPGYGYCDN